MRNRGPKGALWATGGSQTKQKGGKNFQKKRCQARSVQIMGIEAVWCFADSSEIWRGSSHLQNIWLGSRRRGGLTRGAPWGPVLRGPLAFPSLSSSHLTKCERTEGCEGTASLLNLLGVGHRERWVTGRFIRGSCPLPGVLCPQMVNLVFFILFIYFYLYWSNCCTPWHLHCLFACPFSALEQRALKWLESVFFWFTVLFFKTSFRLLEMELCASSLVF